MKEKKDGCCKDEHKQVKLKVEHQKGDITRFLHLITVPVIVTPVIEHNFNFSFKVAESYPACHAPPDIYKERLHILHCLFLI